VKNNSKMADEEEVFDEVTEETTEGYGSRLSNSFSGICFGLLLFFGSGVTLFWNEGVAAKRYVALKQGSKLAMEVKNNVVLPENEGKLVVFQALLLQKTPLLTQILDSSQARPYSFVV